LWICNLLAWAKLPSPLPCFNKEEVQVEVVEEVVVQETAPVEEVK
jgi:hypothetical protein